jgi:hypothetical protein
MSFLLCLSLCVVAHLPGHAHTLEEERSHDGMTARLKDRTIAWPHGRMTEWWVRVVRALRRTMPHILYTLANTHHAIRSRTLTMPPYAALCCCCLYIMPHYSAPSRRNSDHKIKEEEDDNDCRVNMYVHT